MDPLPMHKWLFGNLFFKISQKKFATALGVMANKVDKAAGQTPRLKVEFYKASQRMNEDQTLDEPVLIGTFPTLRSAPAHLWHDAGRIVATFTTTASDMAPAITATICVGGLNRFNERTRREMHFEVNPPEIGRETGKHFLNVEPCFKWFWDRGIRYD